jgi:DNA/RNA endonuclease G (NUC1)
MKTKYIKSNKVSKLFKTNINIINLPEYTSYYSSEYKFPLIVVENLKKITNKPKIHFVRAEIEDPFRKYEKIPEEHQYSVEDYQLMKKYGLSPGHNAPAGHHKTSMTNWSSTFYHINMAPQDIMLNAGVWLILEQWCHYISKNPIISKMYVITGSIPNNNETNIEDLNVNIPSFMYKIILAANKKNNNKLYIACFLYPNKPIIPEGDANLLSKYLIDIDKLSDMTKLNMKKIINFIIKKNNLFYNKNQTIKLQFNSNNLSNNINNTKKKTIRNIKFEFLGKLLKNGIKFNISNMLSKSLINGKYFGLLINSKTLDELEQHWIDYQKRNEKENLNRSLEYHKEYYELAKQRIIENKPIINY